MWRLLTCRWKMGGTDILIGSPFYNLSYSRWDRMVAKFVLARYAFLVFVSASTQIPLDLRDYVAPGIHESSS